MASVKRGQYTGATADRALHLVVSLLIVNSDNVAPSEYDTVFKAAGLDTLAYAPSSASLAASAWPTLGSLIDSGKRLVVFLSTTADFNTVPYLIDGEWAAPKGPAHVISGFSGLLY